MATKTVIEQLIIEIAGDSKKFKSTVKDLKRDNQGLEASFKKMGKIGVASFAAVGSAAVLLGTVATKAFAEFETGVTNVAKTTNLAGKDLEDFKDEIIKMSERIPVTTDKLLEIATAAGQLGIKGTANLSKFTEVIAKLGATTDLEGEQAALAIARILNLTNESIQSVDKLGSTLVELGNNFAASESEILEVAKDVAKATVNFDLASNEILGISAAMASLGIAAEVGGTVVAKAFQAIDQAIRAKGGPAFDKLVELTGIAGDQLEQTFATDASAVFAAFIKGLGKAGESGKDLTAELAEMELSGIRVNKILPTLASRSDILADAMESAGIASKNASALNEEATKAFATTSNQMVVAQTKLNNSMIRMGEEIAPDAVKALNDISTAVSSSTTLWALMGKGIGLAAKGLSNIIRFFSSAVELGGETIADFKRKTQDQAKAQDDFLKEQLKKRNVRQVDFRKLQRKNRRASAKEELKDTKKGAKDLTKAEKEESNKKLAAVEAENMRKAEIQAAADDSEFEEIENFSDQAVEEYENRNARLLTEQSKADEEKIRQQTETAEISKAIAEHELDKEIAAALKAADEKIKIRKKHFGELDDLHAKHNNGILLSETALGKQMVRLKEIQGTAEYGAVRTAASELAVLINSSNNELKAIGKAATIVQIGLATAESAMKAYASLAWIFPPIGTGLGLFAAAAVTTYGATQIADVASMQTGGVVPGTGSGDIVPAMLEPGELVVPKDITSELMNRLGAHKMADGGVVNTGAKEKKGLDKTFNDIFGIPGIFLSILGLDGGDTNTNASGFGAQFFDGVGSAMMDPLTEAADEMLKVMLSTLPGGALIFKMLDTLGLTPSDIAKFLKSGPGGEILKGLGLDDDVARIIIDVFGGATDIIGGAVGAAEDILKTPGRILGFQNGGIVPGAGTGDIVPALLEPGELVIPKSFVSSISGSGAGSGPGGVEKVIVGFDIGIQDDLVDFITVKQREKDILGT